MRKVRGREKLNSGRSVDGELSVRVPVTGLTSRGAPSVQLPHHCVSKFPALLHVGHQFAQMTHRDFFTRLIFVLHCQPAGVCYVICCGVGIRLWLYAAN